MRSHPNIGRLSASCEMQVGWRAIVEQLKNEVRWHAFALCIECYPGLERHRAGAGESLKPDSVFPTATELGNPATLVGAVPLLRMCSKAGCFQLCATVCYGPGKF